MKGLFRYVFSRSFLIQLGIAMIVVFILLYAVLSYLTSYTYHGQTITVPNLNGLSLQEVEDKLLEKQLKFVILDSVFVSGKSGGVVVDQEPFADDLVKVNRNIYLTITKMNVPKVAMPNVVDMSQRLAVAKLQNVGLKVGELKYVPSPCVNCVIKQLYKGKRIAPKTMISKESKIELVLGKGTSTELTSVPDLFGSTPQTAKETLQEMFLNIGAEVYVGCKTKKDSMEATVYKQLPRPGGASEISLGGSVDVWYGTEEEIGEDNFEGE